MKSIMYITLSVGVIIFIFSILDIKKLFFRKSKIKKKYKSPNFKFSLFNFSGFSKLVKVDSKKNMEKFKYITEYNKVLNKNETESISKNGSTSYEIESDSFLNRYINKYYFASFITPFILLIIIITGGTYFKNLAFKAAIDPYTISSNTSNIISEKNAEVLMNKYNDVFEDMIIQGKVNEFREDIKSFIEINTLNLDDKGIETYIQSLEAAIKEKSLTTEEYVMAISLAFASIIIINSMLNLKYHLVKRKLYEEFNNLEMIALLHIRRKGVNVYFILNEMNKYSYYLKPYLTRCLNRYTSEPLASLNKLALEVNDIRFKRFIDILKSAHSNSSELNGGLLYYQRKLRFEEGFNKKEKDTITDETVLTLIQIPLIAVIVFMCMLPLLQELSSIIQKM